MNAETLKNDILSSFADFAPSGLVSECEAHDGLDFDEFRDKDNVLAVVVNKITEANIGLPDYFVDVTLILDCRIQQEDSKEVYEKLTTALSDRIEALTARGEDIRQKFTAPVVGTHQATEITRSIGGDSNITTAVVHFVLSYED